MKLPLDQIEARLQHLIENNLPFMSGANRNTHLAHELVEAMNEHLTLTSGKVIAPHIYILHLSEEQVVHWQANPTLLRELTRAILQAATEAGITFHHPPVLRLEIDHSNSAGEIRVTTTRPGASLGDTAGLPSILPTEQPLVSHPGRAFLILKGSVVHNINHSVINIGRRADNQLIIDDARVSRSHAQIRQIRGNYVLFDLNSTGGTYVNNERIQQKTLKAGDVISLAGVPIIFGVETILSDPGMPQDPTSTIDQNADDNPKVEK